MIAWAGAGAKDWQCILRRVTELLWIAGMGQCWQGDRIYGQFRRLGGVTEDCRCNARGPSQRAFTASCNK